MFKKMRMLAAAMGLSFANPVPTIFPTLNVAHEQVGRKGAGITMAQQQRAATKKRNRARHRAHCK